MSLLFALYSICWIIQSGIPLWPNDQAFEHFFSIIPMLPGNAVDCVILDKGVQCKAKTPYDLTLSLILFARWP